MATILVIDDDELIRAFARAQLEANGHAVHEAANGEEGLQAFRTSPVDVVICDIFMPEKEGLGTIRDLSREYPGLKIIAISGGSPQFGTDFGPMARRFGAHVYLEKPFTPEELLGTVETLLS